MVYWLDNFDGETEGSPPMNWTPGPDTCEVDNVHSHSGSHAMWIRHTTAQNAGTSHNISFTGEEFVAWFYYNDITSTQKLYLYNQAFSVCLLLYFAGDGSIHGYDAGVDVDTGTNTTTNVFHKLEIIVDVVAGTWSMWHDDTPIITDWDLKIPATSLERIYLGMWGKASGADVWWDDIQVGTQKQDDNAPSPAGTMCGARI